ncbi:MAG TPA: hypothetical protein VJ323_08510, partial [Bryobacteraceae bacterium]|nr:hypothetical protein [Bryobacteraceae bacterium]
PITTVVINMRVTHKSDPDGLVGLDLDFHPAPGFSRLQMPLKAFASLFYELFGGEFTGWQIGKYEVWGLCTASKTTLAADGETLDECWAGESKGFCCFSIG